MNREERLQQMRERFGKIELARAQAKGIKLVPMQDRIAKVEGRDDAQMPISLIPVTLDEVRDEAKELDALIEFRRDEDSAREALTSDER